MHPLLTASLTALLAHAPLVSAPTTKTAGALEMCLGLKVAERMPPSVLRGDGATLVMGTNWTNIVMAFRIEPGRVTAYGTGAWKDDVMRAVVACA